MKRMKHAHMRPTVNAVNANIALQLSTKYYRFKFLVIIAFKNKLAEANEKHENMFSVPMDVADTYTPSTSAADSVPQIYENDTDVNPKQRVMEILDNLESHVEKLRKDASRLEEEKDVIMGSLDAVRLLPVLNDLHGLDKEEAQQYLERIIDRCHTVSVNVYTQRDKAQEDALHQVNQLIDNLVILLKTDHEAARIRCLTYMNSCSSGGGITDKLFESALLGCTMDDQKRVKKRLLGLLKYLDKMGIVSEV